MSDEKQPKTDINFKDLCSALSEHRFFCFKRVYFLLVRTLKMENVGGNGAVEMSELLVYISRKGVKAAGDL